MVVITKRVNISREIIKEMHAPFPVPKTIRSGAGCLTAWIAKGDGGKIGATVMLLQIV